MAPSCAAGAGRSSGDLPIRARERGLRPADRSGTVVLRAAAVARLARQRGLGSDRFLGPFFWSRKEAQMETTDGTGTAGTHAQRHLIRLALPDRPGGLALVTRCLASCGVDILAVEVVGHRDSRAIDDLLVCGGDLERALAALAPEVTLLGARPSDGLPDPGIAMAEAFARTFRAPDAFTARDALIASLAAMIGADATILLMAADGGRMTPLASVPAGLPPIAPDEPSLARRVLRSGVPVIEPARDAWAPLPYRNLIPARHVACTPVDADRGTVLLLARLDDFPFVDAELERARAFVTAATEGLPLPMYARRPSLVPGTD
jgi:hypothetical protein